MNSIRISIKGKIEKDLSSIARYISDSNSNEYK